MQDFVAQ